MYRSTPIIFIGNNSLYLAYTLPGSPLALLVYTTPTIQGVL